MNKPCIHGHVTDDAGQLPCANCLRAKLTSRDIQLAAAESRAQRAEAALQRVVGDVTDPAVLEYVLVALTPGEKETRLTDKVIDKCLEGAADVAREVGEQLKGCDSIPASLHGLRIKGSKGGTDHE